MKLVIVHYHLRPGGIRRIIELATPHLVAHSVTPITHVTLVTGEARDHAWNEHFRRSLRGVTVDITVDPAFGYLAECRRPINRLRFHIQRRLSRLLAENPDSMVWAHNLGIARNLVLGGELARACARLRLPLIAHHHDWWFDHRWQRWPEIRRCGVHSLAQVAPRTIVTGPRVMHVTINRADAAPLRRHLGRAVAWLPNLAGELRPPRESALKQARAWLDERLGADNPPVWIFPCRLLRRKNLAEALLLTRWLRPGAWLVTTGGPSSRDETDYANTLASSAKAEGWPLQLSILSPLSPGAPGIPELLGVSEAVLLTSIQEGFGLPYLEAVAAGRPLVARKLPNIAPDLSRFGFRFPHSYSRILVAPTLFDWVTERDRQETIFRHWQDQLPLECRKLAGLPHLLAARQKRPVPFHGLTLAAQLEVLRHDPESSWERCLPFNRTLEGWRRRARRGKLEATPWPESAGRWLSGAAYAGRFFGWIRRRLPQAVTREGARAAQDALIKTKLAGNPFHPLLSPVSPRVAAPAPERFGRSG